MQWFDILTGVFLAWAAFKGFRRGFIREMITLICFILGIWAGFHFAKLASGFLKSTFDIQATYLPIFSFLFIFIVVMIGGYFVGKVLEKSVEMMLLGWLNKLLGIVFGVLKQALILSFVLMIVNNIATSGDVLSKEQQQKSFFYKSIKCIGPLVLPEIKSLKREYLPESPF
ncbi:MAG: CvpA family protein [Bacteroidota bacterium]